MGNESSRQAQEQASSRSADGDGIGQTKQVEQADGILKELQDINQRMSERERRAMEEEHGWSRAKHSSNIVFPTEKPLTFSRKPVAQTTDAALSRNAYSKGVHFFEITWPSSQRGSHPLVGEHFSVLCWGKPGKGRGAEDKQVE